MKITAADINIIHSVLINVVTMLYKTMTLQTVYSLSYLGENVNMVCLLSLVAWLARNPLRIHKSADDVWFRLDIGLCNETRL